MSEKKWLFNNLFTRCFLINLSFLIANSLGNAQSKSIISPKSDTSQSIALKSGQQPLVFSHRGRLLGNWESIDDREISVDFTRIALVLKKEAELASRQNPVEIQQALAQNIHTLLISIPLLTEIIDVLQRTIDNGGIREESSLVLYNGEVRRAKSGGQPFIQGNWQIAHAYLPEIPAGYEYNEVEATIHSHPIKPHLHDNKIYAHHCFSINLTDAITFSKFRTNVVVGALKQNLDITEYSSRPLGAVIYQKGKKPITVRVKALRRIIKKLSNLEKFAIMGK